MSNLLLFGLVSLAVFAGGVIGGFLSSFVLRRVIRRMMGLERSEDE